MRLVFIQNNLSKAAPPIVHHAHGHRVAGKRFQAQLIAHMLAVTNREAGWRRRQHLEQTIAAQHAFEDRLAKARENHSLVKTSIFATILSEV